MNGWTQEEIDKIEKEAARKDSILRMVNYLHVETGLSYAVCEKWAAEIEEKKKTSQQK